MRTVLLNADGSYQRDCRAGESGVLMIAGEALSPGYTDAEKNAGLFATLPAKGGGSEVWLNTRDLAAIDEDGYLFLRGRARDLIIRGGHNIDPGLIEEALNAHPAVAEAAAVGQPDVHAGEVPVAFVLLKPETEAVSESELLAYARAHVPERAAIPKRLIIKQRMPQTDIGKTDKKSLRAEAAQFVLKRALLDALDETAFELSVVPDPAHGIRAVLQLRDTGRQSAAHSVLDSFPITYDISTLGES
ncbi:MAG: AMP-binding protein, partial [Alphaproteobacteria bacterium]|nr:AMP-binding protein [Alphaproteobacteria bacterium]